MEVIKRNGNIEEFNKEKIKSSIEKTSKSLEGKTKEKIDEKKLKDIVDEIEEVVVEKSIEKIESEGNKIKTYLETWVQNSTGNLSKTIDIIKSRVRIETWEKIKSGIDNSITKSFDSIFATAFSKLVTLNNNTCSLVTGFSPQTLSNIPLYKES